MCRIVVLAYSGGVDTSVAIKRLSEKYNLDVIALTVDVGDERYFSVIRQKAFKVGAEISKGGGLPNKLYSFSDFMLRAQASGAQIKPFGLAL